MRGSLPLPRGICSSSRQVWMVQGFHTFLILCVTGAIHLHSAWGLPSDGFYSWVQKVWMSQLFYTFPRLCVTGAIHLHSAWGPPSDGFFSWAQKVWMSQLFYTFPILCVTGAMNLHSALGRPSEFLGFPEIRKCGNLEIKEFLCKSIKNMKKYKKIIKKKKRKKAETFIKKYKINTLESFYVNRISRFSGNSEFGDFREIRST